MGRRRWLAVAVMGMVLVAPAATLLVLGRDSVTAWQGLGTGLLLVLGCLLLYRYGGRVVLNGSRLRAPRGARLEASEIARVSMAWSRPGCRVVRVESCTGDVWRIDLGDTARNEEAEATIAAWATAGGGNRGPAPLDPIPDGTVLYAGWQRALLTLILVAGSWGACALRGASVHPPFAPTLIGVLGLFSLAWWAPPRFGAGGSLSHLRVHGDRLEVSRFSLFGGYDDVPARRVVDVDVVWDGLRLHRTDGTSLPVQVPASRHGLCGSLLVWANEHGGAGPEVVPAGRSTARTLLGSLLVLGAGAVLTPGWWALAPRMWAFPVVLALVGVCVHPLLATRAEDDSRSATDGR